MKTVSGSSYCSARPSLELSSTLGTWRLSSLYWCRFWHSLCCTALQYLDLPFWWRLFWLNITSYSSSWGNNLEARRKPSGLCLLSNALFSELLAVSVTLCHKWTEYSTRPYIHKIKQFELPMGNFTIKTATLRHKPGSLVRKILETQSP